MIRNNLSLLLTERQLRISKLANDTGISRTTLTSLSSNSSKMVQLETINRLCQALKINPNNFFEYVPFDFKYFFDIGDISNPSEVQHGEPELLDSSLIINIYENEQRIDTIEFTGFTQVLNNFDSTILDSALHPTNQDELDKLSPYLQQLSISFIEDVKKDIEAFVLTELKKGTTKPVQNDLDIGFDETSKQYDEKIKNRIRESH